MPQSRPSPAPNRRCLYKYRAVDKYTADIFCRGVLYFNVRENFNDPYDLDPVFSTQCSEVEFHEHIRHTTAREDRSQEEIEELVRAEPFPPTAERMQEFEQGYRARLNRVGIYSLSGIWWSTTMWAHYADDHRGICLGFDTKKLPAQFAFQEVQYSASRPVVNLFTDHAEANAMSAFTKNREWSYEKEWRLVLDHNENAPFPTEITLLPGLITEVILGPRIEDADRERVTDWNRSLDPPARISVAEFDDRTYRLRKRPVS